MVWEAEYSTEVSRNRPPAALASLIAAVALATIGMLPAALVGASSPLLLEELGSDLSALGLAVASFFASAAVSSAFAGRLSARIGPTPTGRLAGGLVAVALLFVGTLARSWEALTLICLVAGCGNSLAQVAANHLLAVGIPAHRHGFAYGLKQSAIPMASVFGGLSLSVLGEPFGWPVPFLVASLAALSVAAAVPHAPVNSQQHIEIPPPRVVRRSLIVVAISATLGSAAGNSLTPFLPSAVTEGGLSPGDAGLLLSLGASAGVATRILMGLVADRIRVNALWLIAILLAIGSAGMVALSVGASGWGLVSAVLLAFAGGWGWAGLLTLTVVRTRGDDAASAFGLVAIGPYLGAMIGPAAFGLVASRASYDTAWKLMALVLLVGAAVAAFGMRRISAEG